MKQKAGVSELLRAYGTIFAGILIVIVFSVMRPDAFFTMGNLVNITRQISLLVIIALGATLVMSVEEFDLSVGALASLGGVIGAKMAVAGAPIFLCFIAPVVICFAIGFVNGWIVTKFRVLSFITTLAMSTILGGFTFWFTGGATVFQDIPKSFTYVGTKTVLGAPILSIIMLLLTVVFWFVMRHTAFGRKLYAIGGNEAASQVSGINVKKYKKPRLRPVRLAGRPHRRADGLPAGLGAPDRRGRAVFAVLRRRLPRAHRLPRGRAQHLGHLRGRRDPRRARQRPDHFAGPHLHAGPADRLHHHSGGRGSEDWAR